MEGFATAMLCIHLFFVALLIAGLFKPWLLLWWKDVQNRRKVISLYGSLALVSLFLYLTLIFTTGK